MKKLSVIAAVLVFAVLTVFVVRFAKNEFSQRETKIVVVDPAKSIPKAEEGKVIVLSDEGYETDNDSYYEYRGELYLELQYANEHYSGGQFFYVEGSRTVVYTSSTRIVNCELGKDYDLRFGSTRSGLPTFLFVETVEEESSAEESGNSSAVSEEESVPEESSEEEEETGEDESTEEESGEEEPEPLPEGRVFVRAQTITDIYGVPFTYLSNRHIMILENNMHRYVRVLPSESPSYLKANDKSAGVVQELIGREEGFQVFRELREGEILTYFGESDKFYRVADEAGILGYVEKTAVSDVQYEELVQPEVRAYELDEQYRLSGPISVMWQYYGEGYGYIDEEIKEHYQRSIGIQTVVAPTFLHVWVEEDGRASIREDISSEYIEWAHEVGFKVWVTLENVDNTFENLNEAFHALLADTEARQALVEELYGYYKEYGFDGLNIDLEALDEETGPYFVQFMRELSARVRPFGCMLSVDLSVPTAWNTYYEHGLMGTLCDYVCLMAYDEHYANDTTAGSVASFPWVQEGVNNCLTAGIQANKLVLCMPLYTRFWYLSSGGIVDTDETYTAPMENAWNNVRFNWGVEPEWDSVSGQYYAENVFESGARRVVWLEDSQSMQLRLDLATYRELGGVALWMYGWDTEEIWQQIAVYMNKNR